MENKTISQKIAEVYVPLKFEDIDQRTIENAKIGDILLFISLIPPTEEE